jgi:hypothetical protein
MSEQHIMLMVFNMSTSVSVPYQYSLNPEPGVQLKTEIRIQPVG